MNCVLPFLCWVVAAASPSAPVVADGVAAAHPYSDVGMRANGRHIGDIGGKPYVAHGASFSIEGASGERYPVYVYPAAR